MIQTESRFQQKQRMNNDFWLSEKSKVSTGQQLLRIGIVKYVSFRFAGQGKRKSKFMKAKEFEKKFDSGEDIMEFLDKSKARRPGREQRRVNVDLPEWMIASLDKEARRLGVTRQSIIKFWIAQQLEKTNTV